jgi:hypothetical protein
MGDGLKRARASRTAGNCDITAGDLRAGDMLRLGISTGYVLLCDVAAGDNGAVQTSIHSYGAGPCRPWTFSDPARVVHVGRRDIAVPAHDTTETKENGS